MSHLQRNDRHSIFGDTYNGVPSPFLPHEHPYPTRYHGPMFETPQSGHRYVQATYAKPPFAGVEALSGCGGDCGCESCSGLGATGQFDAGRPPLLQPITGSATMDAVIGGVAGFLAAPSHKHAVLYAATGAVASGVLGTVGLLGFLGFAVYGLKRECHAVG